MTDKILNSIYYNTTKPGSFSGAVKLYKEAIKHDPLIKISDVNKWLNNQLTHSLHKRVIHKFKRNPIVSEYINDNFQADLVDMKEFAKYNNGFTFILTVIDVFSKKAWATPLKNKSGLSIVNAMGKIFLNVIPNKLQTDKGKEFENNLFKELMKKNNINHFTSENPAIKCSIIERFNKTLKNKMFKYFTSIGKRRYINVLESLINSYNNSYHSSIKMSPNQVNESNRNEVFKNLYGVNTKREMLKKNKKAKYKIADTVRLKYDFKPLDRGYYPNWTDKTFNIKQIIKNNKPLYKVTTEEGVPLKRRFYSEEIQKTNNLYRVEKIIKEKFINGIKHYFVKWLNHNSNFNSWIKASDIFNINNG